MGRFSLYLFDLSRNIVLRNHARFEVDFARLIKRTFGGLVLIHAGLEFSELLFVVLDPRFRLLDLLERVVNTLLQFRK